MNTARSCKPLSCYVLRWIPVLAWAAFIFLMSSHTSNELGTGIYAQIKAMLNAFVSSIVGHEVNAAASMAHFFEYAVLGALIARALDMHVTTGIAASMAILLASLYGVSDEYHQLYVKGRYCDPVDWVVDTAGASLGAGLRWLFVRRKI